MRLDWTSAHPLLVLNPDHPLSVATSLMNNRPLPLGSPCTQTQTSTQFPLLYLSFINHHTSPSRETSFPTKGCCCLCPVLKEAVTDLSLLGGDPLARWECLVGVQVLWGHTQ